MKPQNYLAHALGICAIAGAPLFAQTVEIDPADLLTDPTSLADWETDGDQQGWTGNQLTPSVAGGILTGTTEGGDPQIILNPLDPTIPTGTPSNVILEFELKRSAFDTGQIQVFWDDNNPGGFAGTRTLVLPGDQVPTDGDSHLYRFTLPNVSGSLLGLRIDPTNAAGVDLEFDNVNVKVLSGAPVINPTDLINNFTSLGEWNTDDEFESWVPSAQIASATVTSGILSGSTSGNDPQVVLQGLALDTNNGANQIIEVRFRRQIGDTTRLDLFWGDDNGGFAADRRAIIPDNTFPDDGEFHIIQFPLGDFITGNLASLRLDPVTNNPNSVAFAIDYVRIGTVDADDDNDGLANSIETGTGIFNGPSDTGTNPNDDDSDDDTFLDGVEVAFGTNPNDAADFPSPALTAYSGEPAAYLVDEAITANNPTVVNGTPTGFTIDPALPTGLTLDPTSGVITGTPTEATDSAVYTVTATFAGDLTSTYEITLEVLNPSITSYTINSPGYDVATKITPNEPTTAGPAPTSYSIDPALPTGLVIDGTTGTITGTPTEVTPQAAYTVTTSYASYPDTTFTLNIQIKAVPIFLGSDNEPLGVFASLGEWETEGDLEGWTVARASGTVTGGILAFAATGADPQLIKGGGIDTTQGQILEIRSRQNDTKGIQFFWADVSGGYGGARAFTIGSENINPDGEFHTYQVDMTGVFVGDVRSIRFDPGNIGGRTVDIDYIRLGTATSPADPLVTAFAYDSIFGEVSVTWTSVQNAQYSIEGSPDLENWIEIEDGLTGDNGDTSGIFVVPTTDKFFRIVRQD